MSCTQKWCTNMYAQLQPEDLIDFTVKLKLYSLYNSSCQRSKSDFNGNAQFTRLQVWTLYQNTSLDALSKHAHNLNLVLQSIFTCKRNVPTHTQSLHGNWDWIKNFPSLVPKADSKIVQLDLLGGAVVFFSFISWLQICFSLCIIIDHSATMLI